VILPGLAHSPSFWSDQPEAGATLITTFFDSGSVDDTANARQSVDFTLEMMSMAIGKILAGSMVLLALVAITSLWWMPRHMHKQGRFGAVSGAMLRSLYLIVLGLGGWSIGALLGMTVMPGISIDNDLLVVVTVGVPVGLGICWAWVHRNWSANWKGLGLAAAASSALVGAWLGFGAGEEPGVLTAIVGSTVGANLSLILLDMYRAGQAGSQPSTSIPFEVAEDRVSTAGSCASYRADATW
jgi:hypothetical protein